MRPCRSDVLPPAAVQEATVGWVYRTTVHAMQQDSVQETARATQARRSTGVPRASDKALVTDSRVEKALHFLATTDERCAIFKTNVARSEYAAKLARARIFLTSDGSSVEARKAQAECSQDVQDAESRVADAIEIYERLRAKRATEELIVEVFRTVSANRRQGNI